MALLMFLSHHQSGRITHSPLAQYPPYAALPTMGRIGFQGKHAGAPIWFRNMKIKVME